MVSARELIILQGMTNTTQKNIFQPKHEFFLSIAIQSTDLAGCVRIISTWTCPVIVSEKARKHCLS